MRIGAMVVVLSLAASLPAFADPDSAAPASAPAVSAQAAPSAPAAQAAPVAQADAAPNLDEIVCKSSPPATGTRLGGGRECHTVRQWNERQREDQRIVQQQQSVGMASSGK